MTSLAYDDTGSGEPVLFIAGTGGAGRTWHIHPLVAHAKECSAEQANCQPARYAVVAVRATSDDVHATP